MPIQLSVAVRNARLQAIEATAGTTAKLDIRTTAKPSNCAAANTGASLCLLTLPSDWMSDAASGDKAKLGAWTGTVTGTGTAAHFRLFANDGTTCHMQGDVSATGGGGDLTLDIVALAPSAPVTITGFTLTDGNA